MKRIYWMVLRSYVGPLALTFFIAVFVLLMQFIWVYIDEMVGKGLSWTVIAELLFYASWTTVPMALPLSILLSSLMTFGNLGEHYELVAIKSAGISFWKTMRPLIISSLLISIFAFFFSNNALPYVELKRKSLLYDVKHKKLSFNIKEGEFYHDIDGYVIRVGNKDKNEKTLHDILIYDHTDRSGATKMTIAEKGIMEMVNDGNTILLVLENGWNYEESSNAANHSSGTQNNPMQRIRYEKQTMHFDISNFAMSRTDEDLFKSNYTMLNISQLNIAIDSLKQRFVLRQKDFVESSKNNYAILYNSTLIAADSTAIVTGIFPEIQAKKSLDNIPIQEKKEIIAVALRNARNVKQTTEFFASDLNNQQSYLRKHEIVRNEKFTLSFACLVLFFIGAPLGSIIRKGGLGFPLIMATFLFIIFHVINMIGKKNALVGSIPLWLGGWLSTIVLFPFGLFLTLKASNDSPIFDMDSWKKIIYRFILKKNKHENSISV
jgi:lipopolysaccharide export system permease protein